MITFFFDIATAPFARLVVTIMGSISGVSPTAMDIANSRALSQSPFVIPLIKNTIGTITSINLIKTQDTELTPFSKLVTVGFLFNSCAISPNIVSLPVATTIPLAKPLITLVPINTRLSLSRISLSS